MVECIYPEGARVNMLASMYSEIAMESYFYASKCYQVIRDNNYSRACVYDETEMDKHIVKTVVFSAMSIESFLNDYAAACLGDSEFYENFDKLSAIGKFQLIAKFILKCKVEKDRDYYFYLKTLFRLRDSYVHNKSKSFDLTGFGISLEDWDYIQEMHKEEVPEDSGALDKDEIDNDFSQEIKFHHLVDNIIIFQIDHLYFIINNSIERIKVNLPNSLQNDYRFCVNCNHEIYFKDTLLLEPYEFYIISDIK